MERNFGSDQSKVHRKYTVTGVISMLCLWCCRDSWTTEVLVKTYRTLHQPIVKGVSVHFRVDTHCWEVNVCITNCVQLPITRTPLHRVKAAPSIDKRTHTLAHKPFNSGSRHLLARHQRQPIHTVSTQQGSNSGGPLKSHYCTSLFKLLPQW